MSTSVNQETEQKLVLGNFFPYRLSVLAQVVSGSVAEIYTGRFELRRAEWRVLAALGEHQPMSAKEIAAYTHMEKMPVSRAITALKSRELVEQKVDERDRRYSRLSLTEEGMAMYAEIVPGVLEREKALLASLDEHELAALESVIAKLHGRVAELSVESHHQP